ncbi:FliO/MopB family protein [Arthrobacter sp. NyZ413]|uniref:FliO/MopB family protein n=1 Tax=Arthrobacter sp. NyZ413 TaxID=3144669 RepID=UPI003BF8758C
MDSLILGLRVLVALGAVLGLMWVLQRRLLKGKGRGRRRANTTLAVVSRQAVGQKASVVVVDAGHKRFLLGVTEHAISVLHSGEVPPEVPEPLRVPEPLGPVSAPVSFEEIFRETGDTLPEGWTAETTGITRRSELHRRGEQHKQAQPLHGSILAGSTWRQAAEAIRGRRN